VVSAARRAWAQQPAMAAGRWDRAVVGGSLHGDRGLVWCCSNTPGGAVALGSGLRAFGTNPPRRLTMVAFFGWGWRWTSRRWVCGRWRPPLSDEVDWRAAAWGHVVCLIKVVALGSSSAKMVTFLRSVLFL
jgi:hypothetical protein